MLYLDININTAVAILAQAPIFSNQIRTRAQLWGAWWLIPLSKWVITPIKSGLTLLVPFTTGVITHLLSGMSHQVGSHERLVGDNVKDLVDPRSDPTHGSGSNRNDPGGARDD